MFNRLKSLLDQATTNGQITSLFFIGALLLLFLWALGDLRTPFLITIVAYYLLDSLTNHLSQLRLLRKLPNVWLVRSVTVAAIVVFFFSAGALVLFALEQLVDLLSSINQSVKDKHLSQHIEGFLAHLPMDLPDSAPQDLTSAIRSFVLDSQQVQSVLNSGFWFTLTSAENLIWIITFAFVIPIAVFILLQDKRLIHEWLRSITPGQLTLFNAVWKRLDQKLSDYVRGKVMEIFILIVISLIGFQILNLNYSILLATTIGLAAIAPIIGLIIVTIPVVVIAYLQWGFTDYFWYLLAFYTLLQLFDGYILIPFLFGEVMRLHPLAIILGIFVFGTWFGLWGVFFAIPLVILIHTLMIFVPKEIERSQTAAQETAAQENNS